MAGPAVVYLAVDDLGVDSHSDGDAIVFSDEYRVADAFKVAVYRKGSGPGN